MSAKLALIIANTEYSDPGFAQLTAPGKDAKDFGRVLNSPEICAFDDVLVLVNETSSKVGEAIDYFLSNRKPDDLLVLYFSGHGIRDEYGSLYLAVKNTNRARLRSTAIKSDFVREAMDQSRSRRQVLILDCCNSGAFPQGTKAATGISLGTASAFEAGYGRIILTASDSTQYAWEGDKVIGETGNSLFTHFLVEGLEGRADSNGDGQITVDELYEYAYEKVKLATPKQTPSKFSSKQQGEIILRENMRIEDIQSVPLPAELIHAIENPLPFVREGAVRQLEGILNGKSIGLARSAREALERIAEEDDSRIVSRAALQALEAIRQAEEEQKVSEAARSVAIKNTEQEKLAREKAEFQRKAKEEAEKLARAKAEREVLEKEAVRQKTESEIIEKIDEKLVVGSGLSEVRQKTETDKTTSKWSSILLVTLGWAIGGAISGVVYVTSGILIFGGTIGGAIGGFITALALEKEKSDFNWKSLFWMSLAWAIGGAVGWVIGELNYEVRGMAIAFGIGSMISMTIILSMGIVSFDWKSLAWIVLAWAFGGAIGWSGSWALKDGLSINHAVSFATGMGIGWAIPGFVLGWQILNNKGWTKS